MTDIQTFLVRTFYDDDTMAAWLNALAEANRVRIISAVCRRLPDPTTGQPAAIVLIVAVVPKA